MAENEFTPQQIADKTGAHIQTVLKWIRTNQLKSEKIQVGLAHRYKVKESDLQDFMEKYLKQ